MPALDLETPEFDKLVAESLEHLWDFAYLGKHPLAELKSVKRTSSNSGELTHLDYGRVLNELLQSAIESLKPSRRQREFSRERYYSAILYRAYVEGVPNEENARSLSMAERTFYRHKAKAIRVVAQILRDWEG